MCRYGCAHRHVWPYAATAPAPRPRADPDHPTQGINRKQPPQNAGAHGPQVDTSREPNGTARTGTRQITHATGLTAFARWMFVTLSYLKPAVGRSVAGGSSHSAAGS